MIRSLLAAAAILAAAANSFARSPEAEGWGKRVVRHGNAFPLTKFKPGESTISVKVIDTVTKSAYTLSDNFRVVE